MIFGNKEKDEISIRFCGLGGMGVVLVSIILGKAAIMDGKNAIQTQSYGPEQRGTRVKSDLIISESELISFPTDEKVDILVAFSNDAYQFYSSKVKPDGWRFINSDLILTKLSKEKNIIYQIPANMLAKELKNDRLLNIIMLGGLLKKSNLVSQDAIIKSISDTVPSRFTKLNIDAFFKGYEYLK